MTEKRAVTFNADPAIDSLIGGLLRICEAVEQLVPAMSNQQLLLARNAANNTLLDLEKQLWKRGMKEDGDA